MSSQGKREFVCNINYLPGHLQVLLFGESESDRCYSKGGNHTSEAVSYRSGQTSYILVEFPVIYSEPLFLHPMELSREFIKISYGREVNFSRTVSSKKSLILEMPIQ